MMWLGRGKVGWITALLLVLLKYNITPPVVARKLTVSIICHFGLQKIKPLACRKLLPPRPCSLKNHDVNIKIHALVLKLAVWMILPKISSRFFLANLKLTFGSILFLQFYQKMSLRLARSIFQTSIFIFQNSNISIVSGKEYAGRIRLKIDQ